MGNQMLSISFADARLTRKILGHNTEDLVDILKEIASRVGLSHISHLHFDTNKSTDTTLLAGVSTYCREWQRQYFQRHYAAIDPIVKYGRTAILAFDWDSLNRDDPAILTFFSEAIRYGVGRNGLSIPVRSRKNIHSLVSFSSDLPRQEWGLLKEKNTIYLQQLAVLIDCAASVNSKLPSAPVELSRREEECLI